MSAAVCLIGLGEVGAVLADDLAAHGASLQAWDIQFDKDASIPSHNANARALRKADGAHVAARGAQVAISAVTAAQTVTAARSVAPSIEAGAFYLDLNSASPQAKANAAALIADAGGRYVEAAVMSPIAPKRIASPILLGGPHAQAFSPLARDLGFSGARIFSDTYGQASAAKLCRSVMVKGVEALLCESLIAARHYGVEDTVLASLDDLFPGPDWPTLSRYMISRAVEHGTRRAEEMREAARTVADAGLDPLMSAACVERQDWAAAFKPALKHQELAPMLDALRDAIARKAAP